MIYFQYQRQSKHWKEISYSKKIIQFSRNQEIKCIHGDFESLVIGTETGLKIFSGNNLDEDDKFYSFVSPICAVCVNHESLAIADRFGEVSLWNLVNRTREASIKQKDSLGFSSLIFYNDIFLIGSALNGNIYIYSYETTQIIRPAAGFRRSKTIRRTTILLHKVINAHNSDIFTMVKIKRHLLATGSTDHTIKIWDMTNFKCIKVIKGHTLDILCIACNDEFLWSGSMDKSIKSKLIFHDYQNGT
jgi:WD40 repeat protein